ncbi:MazG nucleotide pyrophosphohydrolase domain-containing protein [Citricoccus sp. NPDC055426]|uniref:MazG nucleotide pyrophosphohydrolase domain-containing protein n=1 Tax=Citricoccus sp. NPDC055426 TaxID=3155536 RepID=UPI00342927FB
MSTAVDRLVWVVARLREHCPWTRRLTHDVLTEYLIEEAYEAVEVIESTPADGWPAQALADGTYERLRLEMGDVLFQVVLHAAIAQDAGGFTFDGTVQAITDKMIRRNPHVFHPDGTLLPAGDLAAASIGEIEKNWERIKRAEREADAARAQSDAPSDAQSPGEGPDAGPAPRCAGAPAAVAGVAGFADVPAHLPALAAAAKVVDRAARQPVDPLAGPGRPPSGPESASHDSADLDSAVLQDEDALGAALFGLVQRSRAAGLDPERALRRHLTRLRHDLSGPAATR